MTSSWLSFDPVFSLWAIALLTLPAFTFFIWKEIKRPHKFLTARILAQFFVLISILGLLVRPVYREQKNESSILLLTPSYQKSKVDSIVKQNSSLKVIRTAEAESYPNSEVLVSYHDLVEAGDLKIIAGQGLPEYAFEFVNQKNFKFIPATLPKGIISFSIPKSIVVNKRDFVKGVFNASGKTTLRLIGPAGEKDSVTFQTSGQFPFELTFKPRQSGLFVYKLDYSNNNGVTSEKLPLEIIAEQKLNVLILQKFPTAEVRYLKNYLVEKGHALALRYQTSKTNFKYEFANLNSIRIDKLTDDLAETFDLIILDNTVLNELSVLEKSVLENAIREGLGAILLAEDFTEKDKTINRFLPFKTNPLKADTVHLRLSGSKFNILPLVPVEVIPDASIQTILQHKGRLLSGYVYSGAGKVGFQLLKETYRISLEGSEEDYSYVWSDLIERTARTKNDRFKINLVNNFPFYSDEPLKVDIVSSGTQPSLFVDKDLIPLTEDVIIDDYWHGKTWADKSGWHRFSTQDSTHLNYFVSNEDEWKTLRIANQMKANELAQGPDSGENASPQFISKSFPALLFFLVFLVASGFLWLAPKI